jgi:RimJ/RimL family protein N-acetyltransferase
MTESHHSPERANEPDGPWLRPIGPDDQETLRSWRNANSCRFYDQAPVTAGRQQAWYENYLTRADDHLFMVMERAMDRAIGCIGIRFRGDAWHLYNVIRGVSTPSPAGFMSRALALVIRFAGERRKAPVFADVLSDNPALAWYQCNGFVIHDRSERAVIMRWHDRSNQQQGEMP